MKGGMAKKDLSIHQIRDLKLQEINLDDEYQIIKLIGSGEFSRVYLARHKATEARVALKVVPKDEIKSSDLLREFHYSYMLSPQSHILNTYDVAFIARGCYVFAQEAAPFGDLRSAVQCAHSSTGVGMAEDVVKIIVRQLGSALEFMHSKDLVHRDLKPQNILLFKPDLKLVKLTDFSKTRREGTRVKKHTQCQPTCPPEIWETVRNESYDVRKESDVWQLAMLVFYVLTGGELPWQRADITDSTFNEFVQWQKRKTTRIPSRFRRFTPRLLRLFRRVMEIKPDKRYNITEFYKYVDNKWLNGSRSVSRVSDGSLVGRQGTTTITNKTVASKTTKVVVATNATSFTATTVSQGLFDVLNVCGIETTVDRDMKKKRVEQWVMSAASSSKIH